MQSDLEWEERPRQLNGIPDGHLLYVPDGICSSGPLHLTLGVIILNSRKKIL